MFKFNWTKCNIFLRRLFAFTFSCRRFNKETVSVKLRQIELNVKLLVWLFSLKMAMKVRHIKKIKCKWKDFLGNLEGTKLFVHNISKKTSPDDLDNAVSEHGWTLMLTLHSCSGGQEIFLLVFIQVQQCKDERWHCWWSGKSWWWSIQWSARRPRCWWVYRVMILICYQGWLQECGSRTADIKTTRFKPSFVD